MPDDSEKNFTASTELDHSPQHPRESHQEPVEPKEALADDKADSSSGNDSDHNDHAQELQKTESKPSINDASKIPNGGLRAWLQVVGSFALFFNSWGILNTFGVYQTYYESGELFQVSSSNISWIGSLQSFLLLFIGALTGPIYDAGYFRALLLTGSFLVVFGHMMLSLCTEYWQAMLAQAVVVGLGAGCLFVPSVAILSTYFSTKIATSMGLAASGSSLGGVIYPIMFYKLQPQIGFAWTTRVIGFVALATLAIPCTVMKMRVKPPAKRSLWDWSALREPAYVIYVLGAFVAFMGLYVIFFYISYYALSQHIAGENLAFYLLPILNAFSVFGRIVPNFIADKVGPFNIFLPAVTVSGILTLCMLAAKNLGGVIAIAALYGFFSGTFVSLPPTIFVKLSPTRGVIGTRMGMGFTVASFGVLIGAPVGGAILGGGNNFTGLWTFGGVLILSGAITFSVVRMIKADWKIFVKV